MYTICRRTKHGGKNLSGAILYGKRKTTNVKRQTANGPAKVGANVKRQSLPDAEGAKRYLR
jgi:hypothetical protein